MARTSFQTSTSALEPFQSLDVGAAKVLAAIPKGGTLDLSGIRELPSPVAAALASYNGYLGLHSLKTLSQAAAQHLARHKGGIYLGALGRVGDEAARLALQFRDSDGGTSFSMMSSRRIELQLQVAARDTWKRLRLGERLTASIATRICRKDIWPSTVTACFTSIDTDAAEVLVRKGLPPDLHVKALKLFAKDADRDDKRSLREHLQGISSVLDLSGLQSIAADAAAALMRFKGTVDLSGLSTISPEIAEVIGRRRPKQPAGDYSSRILLDGLSELPVEVAKALSACRGKLVLNGLETLSLDAARSLAACFEVELYGLRDIAPPTLDVLARAKSVALTDECIARHKQLKARRVVLPALQSAGFFKYCRAPKNSVAELVYPAPGPTGVYDALLPTGSPAGVNRLFPADVEELLEQGPDWFFKQNLKHLGLDSRAVREVRVGKAGEWIYKTERFPITGSLIGFSSSARSEYAIVAILNRMLASRRRPERAYGVDEGNAFGVAFLTPAMAKLLLKVSEKQVTPRSEAQLRSRAEQACDEGEPPVMESVR